MTESQTDYNWILNIIDSCANGFQFGAVDRLIDLYHRKHGDKAKTDMLTEVRDRRWNNIHLILN